MKRVLVDSSVWSLAFRKAVKTADELKILKKLTKLIMNLDFVLIGPVRQEILSGIADRRRFDDLREKLAHFEDHKTETRDYELAARFYNDCRSHGIQGSHIDFLICAVAANNDLPIMTLDKDFENYKRYVKIKLEETV